MSYVDVPDRQEVESEAHQILEEPVQEPEVEMIITFDDIIEKITNDELQLFKKNPSTFITKYFSQLIPEPKTCDIYFKKQKYENVIKNFKQNEEKNNKNYKFEDIFFRPEVRNITYIDKHFRVNKMIKKIDTDELSKYKFGRISEIESYSNLFNNNEHEEESSLPAINFPLKPSENSEGKKTITFNTFGNMNLYNSIIILIKHKNWLLNSITKMDLKRKLFVLRLYLQGKPKSILIDDHIPVTGGNVPCFIYSSDQIFVLLIEKALAKLNRSYGNIIRSLSSELMPVLSEAPLITYIHKINTKRKLWDLFNEAIKKNWILFSEFDSVSLEYFHSEYFISYYMINIFKVNKNKYVELIVPQNDSQIFSEIKEKIQDIIPEEDLVFTQFFPEDKLKSNKTIFMSFDHFCTSFYKTCILKYEPEYHYNYKKFLFNLMQYNLVKLKISTKTKLFLTLHLKQIRYFIKLNQYEVPLSRLIVAKLNCKEKLVRHKKNESSDFINSNEPLYENTPKSESYFEEEFEIRLDFMDSAYGKQENQVLELNLEEGVYYIFFKVYTDADTDISFNVVLSTYADNPLQFEDYFDDADMRIVKNFNNSLSNCLDDLFSSFLNLRGVSQNQPIEKETDMLYSYSLSDSQFGFSILKLENLSNNKILHLNLHYEIQGMSLISHRKKKKSVVKQDTLSSRYLMSNEVSMLVYPQSKEFVIFEWTKNFSEISINIRPYFNIEVIKPSITQLDFLDKPKNLINKNIFFSEITYLKGVFVIIVNESKEDCNIHIDFENLQNLFIVFPWQFQGSNYVDLIVNSKTKSYVNLKMLKEEDFSYNIKFLLTNKIE